MKLFASALIVSAVISIAIFLTIYCINRFIYVPSKLRTTYHTSTELLDHLYKVIGAHLTVLEYTELRNKKNLSNREFEDYMKTICTDIHNSISRDYLELLYHYVTEDFVAAVITVCVEQYLTTKIKTR